MGLGGLGDWCNPNLSIASFDLPKSGVANAISAIEGQVFTGTGDNASGISYADVNITNTNPPTALTSGTFDGFKTNGIFGENDYAYLATDSNSNEVEIIDLNQQDPVTKKYSEAGYYNVPGNTNANSVYVLNNIGYATTPSKLYTYDLTSRSGSRSDLGNVTLAGAGNKVIVKVFDGNTYAFVAVGSGSNQLQIVQVTNGGQTLSVLGQATVNGGNGVDLFVNDTGTRVYLATTYVAGKSDLFIIDITSKSGNLPVLGTYSTNGMNPKGVAVVPGNHVIIVGTSGEEYQVANISSDEMTITHCGGLNIDTGVNGVASVLEADNDAYSYLITGDASSELKIIEGGPGGSFGFNGTYISAPFDTNGSFSHAFNRFYANVSVPLQTSISLQVAVADAGSNGCIDANYTFIGPDPTDYLGSHFNPAGSVISGQIPLTTFQNYVNPGRCFKYKAYLNTPDSSRTPALLDMNINYSP
jgi:hypothetical protein